MERLTELATIAGLIGNGVTGYQLHQERQHHLEDIRIGRELHDAEIAKAKELHDLEIAESRKLCIAERNTELKQHFQALNADLINSNREAERTTKLSVSNYYCCFYSYVWSSMYCYY